MSCCTRVCPFLNDSYRHDRFLKWYRPLIFLVSGFLWVVCLVYLISWIKSSMQYSDGVPISYFLFLGWIGFVATYGIIVARNPSKQGVRCLSVMHLVNSTIFSVFWIILFFVAVGIGSYSEDGHTHPRPIPSDSIVLWLLPAVIVISFGCTFSCWGMLYANRDDSASATPVAPVAPVAAAENQDNSNNGSRRARTPTWAACFVCLLCVLFGFGIVLFVPGLLIKLIDDQSYEDDMKKIPWSEQLARQKIDNGWNLWQSTLEREWLSVSGSCIATTASGFKKTSKLAYSQYFDFYTLSPQPPIFPSYADWLEASKADPVNVTCSLSSPLSPVSTFTFFIPITQGELQVKPWLLKRNAIRIWHDNQGVWSLTASNLSGAGEYLDNVESAGYEEIGGSTYKVVKFREDSFVIFAAQSPRFVKQKACWEWTSYSPSKVSFEDCYPRAPWSPFQAGTSTIFIIAGTVLLVVCILTYCCLKKTKRLTYNMPAGNGNDGGDGGIEIGIGSGSGGHVYAPLSNQSEHEMAPLPLPRSPPSAADSTSTQPL